MPFIGKASISGNSKFDKYITTVGSGGQTNFPCIIDGGDEYNVYLNGALLKEVLQYTATSSQISLESAASENDKFELHVFRNFFIADAAKRSGDTFTGDVIINDDKKLSFGTTSDVSLENDEDGTDSLLISDKLLIQPPAGGIRFADGTLDVDIASHDGSNGLKLGGTLITQTANNINKLATTGKSIAMAIVFG